MASQSNKNGAHAQSGGAAPTTNTAATLPPSTSVVQAPIQNAPPSVAGPIDVLGQLFQALRPDLDLTQTLASLTACLIVHPPIQPIAPVAQPVSVPPHTEDLTGRSEAGSRGRTTGIRPAVMEEVEEYSGATTELEGEEEGNDEEEVSQPMGNREEVEKTQKVEKEAGQEDVAPEAEEIEEKMDKGMRDKMDEEMEMEKDPAAEE